MTKSFLLDVQELTRPSNVHSIPVRWHTSIKDIKDQLKKVFNAPPSRISLFHSSAPKALKNQIRLHDLGIEKDGHILKVSISVFSNKSFILFPSKDIQVDQNCKDMISIARQGFERSQVPGKTDEFDCTGGVYFLKAASGEKIAVFKPNDEEQGMPNNPKGHAGDGVEGLRPFFQPGQGYIRETAAYIMDYKNFCQVPPTTIVHCEHSTFNYPKIKGGHDSSEFPPKVGSLQQFVYASDTFEDISPSLISCFELQKIAVLDIRLLNCDRNSSNILALRRAPNYNSRHRRDSRSSSMGSFPDDSNCEEEMEFHFHDDEDFSATVTPHERFELVPIDHGYCMPSKLKIDELDWIWFYCAQIDCEIDPEIRKYVLSLNVEELVGSLQDQLKIPEYNCFLLRMSHHVLVEGIKAGLTLFTIAGLIARTVEDVPSMLEKVVKHAEENAYRTIEMRSNRLNSRGTSRATSFASQSGSFQSPTRIRPFPSASAMSRDVSDESAFGVSLDDTNSYGSSNAVDSLYGMSRDGLTSSKRHRVIHSAVNLEALGLSHEAENVARGFANSKYMAFAASLQAANNNSKSQTNSASQLPTTASTIASSHTLSLENVEKLSSLIVHDSDDFYLAELSPHEPCSKHNNNNSSNSNNDESSSALGSPEDENNEAISLGLTESRTLNGSKLVIMHSLDSGASSRGSSGKFSSGFQPKSSAASSREKISHFSCERLDEECEVVHSVVGTVTAVPREVSAPIVIPVTTPQGLSPESDTTSCEASSKEEDGCSPRSFGDNFFLSGESLLYRSSQPFGRSNATEGDNNKLLLSTSNNGSQKERPFPPRHSPLPSTEVKLVSSGTNNSNSANKSKKEKDHHQQQQKLSPDSSDADETDQEVQENISSGRSSSGNIPRDQSQSSFYSKAGGNITPNPMTSLQRVASFNAFESPAIYEDKTHSRQMKMLYREQRKTVSKTPEFLELRLKFAMQAVTNFIEKEYVRSSTTKSKF